MILIEKEYDNVAAFLGFETAHYKIEWTPIEFEELLKKLYPKLNLQKVYLDKPTKSLNVFQNWLALEKGCVDGKIDALFFPSVDVFCKDMTLCITKIRKLKKLEKPPTIYFLVEELCSDDENFENNLIMSLQAKDMVRCFNRRKRKLKRL